MGRPRSLGTKEADQALKLSVKFGNRRAAELSGVSLSTIERLRAKSGLTDPKFLIELLFDVERYGSAHAAVQRDISEELVRVIIADYKQSWHYRNSSNY
jgi:hypothetical protein